MAAHRKSGQRRDYVCAVDFVNVLRASHRDHTYHFGVAVWRKKEAMLSVAAPMSPMRHLRRVRTWRWRHCRRSYGYCFIVQAQLWEWELEIVLLSDLKAEQISAKRPASLLTLPSANEHP